MCDDYCDEWNKELKNTWECGEEMYVCPRCGRLVPMDMNFCGYCGVYLSKEKYCENCQEWNCDYCSRAERRTE